MSALVFTTKAITTTNWILTIASVPTQSATEFNKLYDSAQKSHKLSDAFFYTAAGAFAFNAVDYMFLRRSQMNRIRVTQEKFSGPVGESTRINLSLVKEF